MPAWELRATPVNAATVQEFGSVSNAQQYVGI